MKISPMKFELLNHKQHDCHAFNCGVKSVNVYLQRINNPIQHKPLTRVYVLAQAHRIIGYYALSAHSVPTNVLPVNHTIQRYHEAPFLLLGSLAVDKHYQKQGYGSSLIFHAVKTTHKLAEKAGILGMIADAHDVSTAVFYQKFGFKPLTTSKQRLVLPFSSKTGA